MNKKMFVPNFFIIAPERSGSTSLYEYLKKHPQIFLSPIKEPNYFSQDMFLDERKRGESKPLINFLTNPNGKDWNRGYSAIITNWELYLKLFQNVKNEIIIGEASTSYFSSKIAAKKIFNANPRTKFVILLRNPIDRIYSFYMHRVKDGYIKLNDSFDEFIRKPNDFIENAKYYQNVKRFLDFFPKTRFYFCFFENLVDNSEKELIKLYNFLEIDASFISQETLKYNVGQIPRTRFISWILKPKFYRRILPYIQNRIRTKIKRILYSSRKLPEMNNETKNYLRYYLLQDIMELSNLIDQDLSLWL